MSKITRKGRKTLKIVPEVLRSEVCQITGSVSWMNPHRIENFRYLQSTVRGVSVDILFKAPPLPYFKNLFALSFENDVWISCVVSLTLCALVIWMITKWEIQEPSFIEDRRIVGQNPPNILDIIMMQIGVLCQMDYFHEPKSTSGKIATFTLLLSFSFIFCAFSAKIVILLQSSYENIKDLKALLDGNMEFAIEETAYNYYYLTTPDRDTDEELRKIFYDKIIAKWKKPKLIPTSEGVKLLMTTPLAFHTGIATAIDYVMAEYDTEQKCGLRKVKSFLKSMELHILCARNFTAVEYVSIGYLRLFETGLHAREKKRKIKTLPKCTIRNLFLSVGLIELKFAIELYIAGVLLSLLILIGELVTNKYQKHLKTNDVVDFQFTN